MKNKVLLARLTKAMMKTIKIIRLYIALPFLVIFAISAVITEFIMCQKLTLSE